MNTLDLAECVEELRDGLNGTSHPGVAHDVRLEYLRSWIPVIADRINPYLSELKDRDLLFPDGIEGARRWRASGKPHPREPKS